MRDVLSEYTAFLVEEYDIYIPDSMVDKFLTKHPNSEVDDIINSINGIFAKIGFVEAKNIPELRVSEMVREDGSFVKINLNYPKTAFNIHGEIKLTVKK